MDGLARDRDALHNGARSERSPTQNEGATPVVRRSDADHLRNDRASVEEAGFAAGTTDHLDAERAAHW